MVEQPPAASDAVGAGVGGTGVSDESGMRATATGKPATGIVAVTFR